MSERPIVVGYDGSPGAELALRWALEEAARTDGKIHLVYGFEWPVRVAPISPGAPGYADVEVRRDAQTMIEEAVARTREAFPAADITGSVFDGPAPLALLEQSRRAHLMVLGSRGHGGFTGLLLGSVSVAVSTHAHCPVVVVREPARAADAAPVVVGVDGSAPSLLAAAFAMESAAIRGTSVRVIRAWTPPTAPWGADLPPMALDPDEMRTAERHVVAESLQGWRDKYPDVPLDVRVVVDTPARALLAASRDAQLLVVGTRGRGGFRGLLLGSISQQMLHHAHCPVAVVREMGAPQVAERD